MTEAFACSAIRRPRIWEVQEHVARHYRLPMRELLSNRRDSGIARPRQVAMYLARKLTSKTIGELGRSFDRDHSTILYGIAAVGRRMREDADLAAAVRMLELAIATHPPSCWCARCQAARLCELLS